MVGTVFIDTSEKKDCWVIDFFSDCCKSWKCHGPGFAAHPLPWVFFSLLHLLSLPLLLCSGSPGQETGGHT